MAKWIDVKQQPIPEGEEVIGFNKEWIDEDFNPNGTRIGFINGDGYFTSAVWNNEQDCYDTCSEEGDDYYKGNAYVVEEEKKKALPNMPTHYQLISKKCDDVLESDDMEELLAFIPKEITIDGVCGCFSLNTSLNGRWHCKYYGLIGFPSHKKPQKALKEVIKWVKEGMKTPKNNDV